MKHARWLLALVLLFALALALPTEAEAAVTSGELLGLTWSYDDSTDTLTLSGAVEMVQLEDYKDYPWYQYQDTLEVLVINRDVKSIADYAFYEFDNLREVKQDVFYAGLKSIGECSFAWCTSLETFPKFSYLEFIGDSAFTYCESLTEFVVPSYTKTIGKNAFDASGLTSLTFEGDDNPNSVNSAKVETIGASAFQGTAITGNVEFPASLKTLGGSAFTFTQVESVTFRGDVESIEACAFSACFSLKEIRFNSKTAAPVIGEDAFLYDNATIYYYPTPKWGKQIGQQFGGTLTWHTDVTKLDNVVVYKTNAHSTGNILYWNAVDFGDIYQIYRLNGSSWELLKNTRSLAYKDETAKVGVKHYYKIVARNGDLKSNIRTTSSTAVTRPIPSVLNDVPLTRAIRHSTGNILYWTSVEYADVYQIYRKTDGESSFKCIAGTRSLAYKDVDAPAGKAATYYVLAINGSSRSSANTATKATIPAGSVTKLDNVTITKIVPHSSGNILYWDMVVNAQLYQVYRLAPGSTSWELLTNTGSLGYKDTTAKSGVKYYYKIVARNGDIKSDIKTTESVSGTRP